MNKFITKDDKCHLLFYNQIGGFMLEEMSTDELVQLKEYVSSFKDIDSLLGEIDCIIECRKDRGKLNIRFNMDMFIKLQIFDPSEFRVVRENHINNLQELIDCDLDSLVGITPSIKEGLTWVRSFYDMSSYDDIDKRLKQNLTNIYFYCIISSEINEEEK